MSFDPAVGFVPERRHSAVFATEGLSHVPPAAIHKVAA
jgi:hypothetical protein